MSAERRPNLAKIIPGLHKAQVRVVTELRQVLADLDLPASLTELMNVRASQINGCAACLSVHAATAREAGVSETKLDILPAWREVTGFFTDAERAALDLTEELTRLAEGRDRARATLAALEYFTDEQVAALEWSIIMINSFNRISISSGHRPVR